MVLAFLGFWLWKPSRGLKLTATDTRGQLRISWDAGAQPIAKAKSGAIQIDDHGTRTQLTLTAADLRSGALFYERLSGDVAVSLAVAAADGGSVVESTRFLRPGESAAAPAPPLRQPQPQPAETAQAQPMSSMPATAPAPAAIQPTGAEPTAIRHIVPFRPPAETPRRASAEMPNIAPPTLENSSAIPQSSLPGVLGSEPRPPAPSPAPAAAPGVQQRPAQTSAAPPIVAAPVGGRIIWTGRLAKNGRVTIQRNQASSGAVSGALPGVAAHAIAIPGDLTAYGLTLFTGDQKYSNPITERASPENGWNNTTFTLDPKRASGVRVVEQPSAQNGYKLVLESSSPRISVVMIEWRAAQ